MDGLAQTFGRAKVARHDYRDQCFGDYFAHPRGARLYQSVVTVPAGATVNVIHTVEAQPMSTRFEIRAVGTASEDYSLRGIRPRRASLTDVKARFDQVVCRSGSSANCADHDGSAVMCAAIGTPYLFVFDMPASSRARVAAGGYVVGDPGGRLQQIYWVPN